MDTLIRLILFSASVILVFGDVTHFFFPETNLFQPPQHQFSHHTPPQFLYAAPALPNPVQPPLSSVSSTTEFFLPEIISNRRFKDSRQQGNFIPLNHYLPPPVGDDGFHPIQQDEQTPSLTYLPSKTEKPIVVLDAPSGGSQGYDYNEPSSTSTSNPNDEEPPLQFPSALLPPAPGPEGPVFVGRPQETPSATTTTTTKNPNQGYQYDVPETSFQDNPSTIFQDSIGKSPQVRLHVKEMRCLDHNQGFFRAVLKIESFLSTTPIIENDSINDPKCSVKLSRNLLIINIEAEDFQKCGVHYCGKELCLRLRFPTIRGIRTSFDSLLALRCKTQHRVAAKTHALKMGIANDIQARNTDVYAHGGGQNEFRTHIELLRKTLNGFSKKLEPNDVVRLGEELLLRAHVGPGDGWNFTKLTDVNLQLISGTGELTRSVNLITAHGCVNPSMQSICPQIPTFEPPLGHRFLFKAVMFQEMRSGEEIVLSMKITGCLEQNDCNINLQDCGNFKRQRRNVNQNNSINFSEFPSISFRVEMPLTEEDIGETSANNMELETKIIAQRWIIVVISLIIGSLCFLGVIICYIVRKDRSF